MWMGRSYILNALSETKMTFDEFGAVALTKSQPLKKTK